MQTRLPLAALAATAAVAGLPSLAQAAPGFVGPQPVGVPVPSGGALGTEVASLGDGTTVVLSTKLDGGRTTVLATARGAAAAGFGEALELTPADDDLGNVFADSLALEAAPDGRVVAVWKRYRSSIAEPVLQLRVRGVDGTWGPVQTPDAGVGIDWSPVAATDADGTTAVAWKTAGGDVKVVRRASGSSAFGAPETAASGASLTPALAVAGGRAMVAYAVFQLGGYTVRTAARSAEGTWTAGPEVGSSSGFVSPSLALAADGAAVLGFVDPAVGPDHVKLTSLPAGADAAWTPPARVSSVATNQSAYGVEVALGAGGVATAAWNATDTGETGRVFAQQRPADGWLAFDASAPNRDRLSSGSGFTYAFDLEIAPEGRQVVVFDQGESVRAVQRPGLGTAWGEPVVLSPAGETGHYAPSVDLGTDGEGAAVWQTDADDIDGDPARQVTVAGFDAAGPGFLLPDGAATAGTPLALSVAPVDRWSALTKVDWDFGDGAAGTGGSVTHTYAAAGSYAVTVTTTDAVGNTAKRTATVTVAAPPVVGPPLVPGGGGTTPPVVGPPATVFNPLADTPKTVGQATQVARSIIDQADALVDKTVVKSKLLEPFTFFYRAPAGTTKAETVLRTAGASAAAAKSKTVVVARASKTLKAPTRVKLVLQPTKAGRAALRRAKRPTVSLRVTYTAPGLKPVVVTQRIKVKR